MQQPSVVIRNTQSFCPKCFEPIEAKVIQRDGGIYLDKNCTKHGYFSLLLSRHPDYYKELSDFYFPLFNQTLPQRDYILHLTNKCQLNCLICLATANLGQTLDYPLESLKDFVKNKRGLKFDLMGAEPTTRQDLPEIIKLIESSGNTVVLHTNGIKIADHAYLKELKQAGLRRVSLSFDGFDDFVYEKLRGSKLCAVKKAALSNLEKFKIATDLVVTVARGVNEQEMLKIMNFGLEHNFIKGVFFLGYRFLGKARGLPVELCLMPDELIDILVEQTQGKISRKAIFNFQKLYFAFLAAFSMRKCFYIHHFLIFRTKSDYLAVDQLLNLEHIQKKLEKFKKLKLANKKIALPYFIFSIVRMLLNSNFLFWCREFLLFSLWSYNLTSLPGRSTLIGFISSCDTYSFDTTIAKNCAKGVISLELGVNDSGALNNVMAGKLLAANNKTD